MPVVRTLLMIYGTGCVVKPVEPIAEAGFNWGDDLAFAVLRLTLGSVSLSGIGYSPNRLKFRSIGEFDLALELDWFVNRLAKLW